MEHEPVVTRSSARFCGRCGTPVLFDPRTMRPVHVANIPKVPAK